MSASRAAIAAVLLGANAYCTAGAEEGALSDEIVLADLGNADMQETIIVRGKYLPPSTVSATKTPTPLIDVPQTLSVISREQIEDQLFINIGDLTRFVPGVSIGQGEGHRDQITIRGQNTTADFFIDGLRDDVQYFRPLYNLERVEVLRGSNALIFGRGGGGGVINRVTKKPILGDTFFGSRASVDTFGAVYVEGDGNVEIGDRASVRLNGFYESLDNHRDFFNGDRFGVNPTIGVALTSKTDLILSYEYVNDDRVVDRGVPSLNGEPLQGFDTTFFGDPDFNRTTFEGHIARARLYHDLAEGWTFDATVQFADYDKLYQNLFPVGFDDVAGTVSLDGYIDTTDRQNVIAQSNLIGEFNTGFLGHTLLVGVEYGDQDTDNDRRDSLFADSNDDQITFAFSDPLVIPAVSFPVFNRDRASNVDVISVYAQDQVDIGKHLKLVAGVRYDRFDIDVVDQIEIADGPDDGNDGFLGRVDEEVSSRFGVIYKPWETLSIYGSYSQTFLPRSGDQFLTLSLTNEALEPEEFENFEIGAKWDIRPNLSFTAAIFQLDREGGTTVDPTDVGNTLIIGSRTQGVEFQLVGEILENWSMNAGYSYLDADERGRVVDGALANRTLAQVPEHIFSLWNRYDVTDKLGLGLGVTFQSEQFASISNAVELPDFARVDAALYYEINDRFLLQVNVENLFNSDDFPAAHNDNNISTSEPTNARFTLTARF